MPPTGIPASVTPVGTRTGGAASPLRTGATQATTTTDRTRRLNTADASYLRGRVPPKSPVRVNKNHALRSVFQVWGPTPAATLFGASPDPPSAVPYCKEQRRGAPPQRRPSGPDLRAFGGAVPKTVAADG